MKMFSKKNILKKIKAKALDRKGLGMELAVMTLLVVLGCSMIMVSSALYGRNILQTKEQQIMQRLEIDEFVERKISESSFAAGKYVCVKNKENQNLEIKSQKGDGDTVLLEFEVAIEQKDEITIKKIISWTYTGE